MNTNNHSFLKSHSPPPPPSSLLPAHSAVTVASTASYSCCSVGVCDIGSTKSASPHPTTQADGDNAAVSLARANNLSCTCIHSSHTNLEGQHNKADSVQTSPRPSPSATDTETSHNQYHCELHQQQQQLDHNQHHCCHHQSYSPQSSSSPMSHGLICPSQGPFYFNVPTPVTTVTTSATATALPVTKQTSSNEESQHDDVFLNGVVPPPTSDPAPSSLNPPFPNSDQVGSDVSTSSYTSRKDSITSNESYPQLSDCYHNYSVNGSTAQMDDTSNDFSTRSAPAPDETSLLQPPPPTCSSCSNQEVPSEEETEGLPTLPRRSSIIKNSSRKSLRKKTVSFSSMPTEKTITTGK